jgi:chromosome segregation ATPase
MQVPNRYRLYAAPPGDNQMFGKGDILKLLNRDLRRARDKRDALASDIATLTARIADLEAQITAENDRRERERAASEIEGVKKQIGDRRLAFAPAIKALRDATERATAIVPEAREFNDLLEVIAIEVANAATGLLADLDGRIEALRRGAAAPEPSGSFDPAADLQQDSERVLRLPHWLAQRKAKSAEDPCCSAAA